MGPRRRHRPLPADVPFEVIVLGLVCAVRPTATAAIYALLCSARPRRALLLFLLAGFVFSTSVGVLVVTALHGFTGFTRDTTLSDVVDVMVGAAALGFAAGVSSGRLAGRGHGGERAPSPWVARLREPTAGMLVLAGIATHLPGLLYLAALNVIVSSRPGVVQGVLQVVAFNGLWYSTGAAALIAFIARPVATRHTVDAMRAWLSAHERAVLVTAFSAVGGYFLLAGLVGLAT